VALTRSYKHTIAERAGHDPEFAQILMDEAVVLFLNGEQEMARMILRFLFNPT
jgi:hypothetical protein